MIVCSCNVLSDHQIRAVVRANAPRMTSQVYGCLGCSAQCGRCARTIRAIMDQAMAQYPNECACCPRALAEDAAQIAPHDHHHPRDAREHPHHHHDPHRVSHHEQPLASPAIA
jgi:bacterioferritin-associated ferredoxin